MYVCTQQPKNESAVFSLGESYTYDFLQIIILQVVLLLCRPKPCRAVAPLDLFTTTIVSSSDLNELNSKLNSVLRCISKWFQNNQLIVNLNKKHIVKFVSSKLLTYLLNTACNN